MLNYIKAPRNISEFTLMKGVTDFSNLRQFDPFETSYGFLVVCSTPKFMNELCRDSRVKLLQDTFVHILEGEFRSLDGIPDITADAQTITNGVNELQLISNVNMDTSIQISMPYYERSGAPITNYSEYYLTGIKDKNSKAKTYHGLIGSNYTTITDPGPDNEVFTLLYYVTDNTCRKLEKAFLLANCQITQASLSTLFNSSRGDITVPEVTLTMNAFPITGDRVNLYANKMIEYQLNYAPANKRLILDSNNFDYAVYERSVSGGVSLVKDALNNIADNTINQKYKV